MNKDVEIRRNTNVLFVLNIVVLITMIFFRNYYGKLGYTNVIINSFLIIDILILIIGIIYNVIFIKKPDKYDNKKTFIIIMAIFFCYLLLNTVGTILINKTVRGAYTNMNSKVSGYCEEYICDRYETLALDGYEVFVINNTYYDYDNKENKLEIRTKYNKNEVVSVVATVYSRKQMFSETLIKEKLKGYFYIFDTEINESKIREAFEKRFGNDVSDGNINYKVREVYNKKGELEKLKTIITLDLKQD